MADNNWNDPGQEDDFFPAFEFEFADWLISGRGFSEAETTEALLAYDRAYERLHKRIGLDLHTHLVRYFDVVCNDSSARIHKDYAPSLVDIYLKACGEEDRPAVQLYRDFIAHYAASKLYAEGSYDIDLANVEMDGDLRRKVVRKRVFEIPHAHEYFEWLEKDTRDYKKAYDIFSATKSAGRWVYMIFGKDWSDLLDIYANVDKTIRKDFLERFDKWVADFTSRFKPSNTGTIRNGRTSLRYYARFLDYYDKTNSSLIFE